MLGIAAIAVMGKSGYAYIKSRVFGWLKQYGPPDEVGRTRYTIGLIMFTLPILFGWLAPYAGSMIPGYEGNGIAFAVGGDTLFLASLFVLVSRKVAGKRRALIGGMFVVAFLYSESGTTLH